MCTLRRLRSHWISWKSDYDLLYSWFLSTLQNRKKGFANSVDPDERTRPFSILSLLCLPFCFRLLTTRHPCLNNGQFNLKDKPCYFRYSGEAEGAGGGGGGVGRGEGGEVNILYSVCKVCKQTTKTCIWLCECACWIGPLLPSGPFIFIPVVAI